MILNEPGNPSTEIDQETTRHPVSTHLLFDDLILNH